MTAAFMLALLLPSPVPGDAVEPFAMPALDGPVYEWNPGRVTVLCAFAYWCDTWKTQSDRLTTARSRCKGQEVDFVAVSVDGHWTDVDKKGDWSQKLTDVGGKWSVRHGIDRVPYTLVLDRAGVVVWAGYGISLSDDIVRAVQGALEETPSHKGVLYLTFDDFPAPTGNTELLDALRGADVAATFFVVGESAVGQEPLLRRTVMDGHELAVHCWKHEEKGSDPERCRDWLAQTLGATPEWLRRVGSNKVTDFAGHAFAAPLVDPYDYQRPGLNELRRRVMSRLKPGAVIQLHAGVPETVELVPVLAEGARRLGYSFEKLPVAEGKTPR